MPFDGFMYPNEVELQWSVLIVVYPFVTGLVAGAFILASLERIFHVSAVKPTYRLALLTALSFMHALIRGREEELHRPPPVRRGPAALLWDTEPERERRGGRKKMSSFWSLQTDRQTEIEQLQQQGDLLSLSLCRATLKHRPSATMALTLPCSAAAE